MAGGRFSEDEPISEINMTPFVDIVLVLLVIFMVTSGIIAHKGLQIELPEAATAEALQLQQTMNIVVLQAGAILLDGKQMSVETLQIAGRAAKAKGDKIVAMISADKGVVYSVVVGVMDALRQVGIGEFALQLDSLH